MVILLLHSSRAEIDWIDKCRRGFSAGGANAIHSYEQDSPGASRLTRGVSAKLAIADAALRCGGKSLRWG
ncbi:hypothetical protein Pr1d_22760 [Bythopirellula goksoeyrii]|uniref:Uncharacterized protein n=1 Tax=Bythopirellula goksoeyrii TaxID=1400387 RepID=A0A5B9QDG8_9BACT|nr:hypothetical protein Pr1d_22760 [Bythopirellula goksoeyrii]